MKLLVTLFIILFAIISNAQDSYQVTGRVLGENLQTIKDVDIYLSSHNISCKMVSNGQFTCENSVSFKYSDILLLHVNKEGYRPISLPPFEYGTGNIINPVLMEKTEKHYITIITKESVESVTIVPNVKIGFNGEIHVTNEFGQSIIEIKDSEIIEGRSPIPLIIKKEGYEDIILEKEFYNRGGKIKVIELRKKTQKRWEEVDNTLIDNLLGISYITERIGGIRWMMSNMSSKNLYTWEEALETCPEGWRLPTRHESQKLLKNLGGKKATWKYLYGKDQNILAGYKLPDGKPKYKGKYGYMWTSSSSDSDNAYFFGLGTMKRAFTATENKAARMGCRCLKD